MLLKNQIGPTLPWLLVDLGPLPSNKPHFIWLKSLITLGYSGWRESYDAISVFVDLTKAFDTVNHEILLDKMDRYGCEDKQMIF